MLFLRCIETRLAAMRMDCAHRSVCSWGANKVQAFKTKQFNGAVWLCNITCALASCKSLQRAMYVQGIVNFSHCSGVPVHWTGGL